MEEFTRITSYYVEQESNRFPLPERRDSRPHPAQQAAERQQLQRARRLQVIVVDALHRDHPLQLKQCWFERHAFRQTVGIHTFNFILNGLGAVGLDQLIDYMIVADLQSFCKLFRREFGADTIKLLTPYSALPQNASKLYAIYVQEFDNKKYLRVLGALILFLCVVARISKLQWSAAFNSLCYVTANRTFDGTPLIVGILSILKQFHPSNTEELVALLAQFVRRKRRRERPRSTSMTRAQHAQLESDGGHGHRPTKQPHNLAVTPNQYHGHGQITPQTLSHDPALNLLGGYSHSQGQLKAEAVANVHVPGNIGARPGRSRCSRSTSTSVRSATCSWCASRSRFTSCSSRATRTPTTVAPTRQAPVRCSCSLK